MSLITFLMSSENSSGTTEFWFTSIASPLSFCQISRSYSDLCLFKFLAENLVAPTVLSSCRITAIAAGVDCKHSLRLTTLSLGSTAKLNIVVKPPVLNRKRDIPKICDVASGRTDCFGIYPQRDGKKSNNHWTSIYKINRMDRVCPGHFSSTLKSSSTDWVRTSSR